VDKLANDQTLRYETALRELYSSERAQRRAAEETLKQLTASYGATVRALAALELRDDQTGRHAERVTELALLLTARVEPNLLTDPQLEYGFFLHDLGKIGVPDAVLLKPVVDAFDAITNDRPYRQGRPATVAVEELRRGAGSQFDPDVVREFVALADELERQRA
jgi:HD-GYP domain-containing protein (c-di-GMP phosphodiesterase class II)